MSQRLRSNVGILFSENTRERYIEEARQNQQIYKFAGARGLVHWLKGEYAYLAPNAVANLLRRMNLKFDFLLEDVLGQKDLDAYQVLILANCGYLQERTKKYLENWLEDKNNFLIVSGRTNLAIGVLGLKRIVSYQPLGYTGFRLNGDYFVTSARGYHINLVEAEEAAEEVTRLFEFRGDLTNATTAIKIDLNSPAVVTTSQTIYFGPQIFEYIGGLLQPQSNPLPIMNWHNNKYYFIDYLVKVIFDLLKKYLPGHIFETRLKIWGRHPGVLCIRHDTDKSRDLTFYNYELQNQIPATFAILLDKNRKFWLKKTSNNNIFEGSFHYYTNRFSRFTRSITGHRPSVTRKGLYRQVRIANTFFKIPITTCQRHAANFYYPEIIEAMDYLYQRCPRVSGMGSMFRYTAYRYGQERIDGEVSFTVSPPDISVSFWFPFKMAVSSVENYNILKGWDITHMLEPDSYQIDNIMNTEILENPVFTVGFHPHAVNKISTDGRKIWKNFLYVIEKAKERNYWFANCKMVFERMNDWDQIKFRIGSKKISLFNPTDREIRDLWIEGNSGQINAGLLKPNQFKEIEL